jgi:hypothetical protein
MVSSLTVLHPVRRLTWRFVVTAATGERISAAFERCRMDVIREAHAFFEAPSAFDFKELIAAILDKTVRTVCCLRHV